jgi:regulatory protein
MQTPDDDFETLAGTGPVGNDEVAPKAPKKGPTLKARAIAMLSRRENSRLELQRKLQPHATSDAELTQVLDDLEREKWLSNERFAQSLVHRRSSRHGVNRNVHELRQHGLADDQVAGLAQQLQDTELERARLVWQKKFGARPAEPREYARQFRFMASRGFSPDCLRRILGELPE